MSHADQLPAISLIVADGDVGPVAGGKGHKHRTVSANNTAQTEIKFASTLNLRRERQGDSWAKRYSTIKRFLARLWLMALTHIHN
jgi:hypothetical protein